MEHTPDDASATVPLEFRLHEGFQPVDLSQSPEVRAEQLIGSLRRVSPTLTGEQLLHVVLTNQFAVERMVTEGVVYAANFVGRSSVDPSSATTAQFTVAVHHVPVETTYPLNSVAEGLRRERKRGRLADLVDLPVGRSLVVLEDDRIALPSSLTGAEIPEVHLVRQIQVSIPLVDCGTLVSLSLATEFLRDWEDYNAMMAEICRSLQRKREECEGSIGSVLDGAI